MSTVTLTEEEALEIALAPMSDLEICLQDLLPRSFKARTFYAADSRELKMLLSFERASAAKDERVTIPAIEEHVLPLILRAETARKRAEDDTSDFIGTVGQPITAEATVVFVKDYPSELYGTKWLTILRDEQNNRITYWNLVNIVDPIEAQAFGNDGKRPAKKGDKIKLTATVKEHEVYKGTKGTLIQRARKTMLIKAAEETK